MKIFRFGLAILSLLIVGACSSSHVPLTQRGLARGVPQGPGARSDGSVMLPNQWSLRPVGRQIALGDFPVNIAVTPDGRFAAVLHSGNSENEIIVIDLKTNGVGIVSRASVEESFYGLCFSPDGKQLFCSGAGDEVVHQFAFADGYLSEHREMALRDAKVRSVPSGLAIDRDGKNLFVANLLGHRVSFLNLDEAIAAAPEEVEQPPRRRRNRAGAATPTPTNANFPETLFSTNALLVYTTNTTNTATATEDEIAIVKRAEAALEDARSDLPYPYACVVDEKRNRLYVSFWAPSCVAAIGLNSREVTTRWSAEEHPNEMLLSKSGKHLYVANANRNSVSVLDTETGKTGETLGAALLPDSPTGNPPNSLALSPDEKHLFVANANTNAVAVFDVSNPGKSTSLGFIPVGWYLTSVRVTPDGKELLVANGKGLISKSNRNGRAAGREPPASVKEYIAHLMQGTLSIIDLPGRDKFDNQLKDWTKRAYSCLPAVARTNAVADDATTLSTNKNRLPSAPARWD